MKIIWDDGTETEINKPPKKKEFEPISIHNGCFWVSVNTRKTNIIVNTGATCSPGGCYQTPREICEFINALESAKDFIENK